MRRCLTVTIGRGRAKKNGLRPWEIRWVDPGTRRLRRQGGYRTQALAEIARRGKEWELFGGGGVTPIAWDDFVKTYLGRLRAEGRRTTAQAAEYVLNRFGQLRRPARPDTVTLDMAFAHRAQLFEAGLSDASVRKALATIKAALSAAVDYGHATGNPLKGRKRLMPRLSRRSKRQLARGDIKGLLVQVDDEAMRVAILTAWRTGLRCGELAFLRWEDVDLDDPRPVIRVLSRDEHPTKAGESRLVELMPETAKLLRQWRASPQRLYPGGRADFEGVYVLPMPEVAERRRRDVLSRRASAVFRAAGLGEKGDGLHWLRSVHCTDCLASGMPVDAVKRRLGHKAIQTTLDHYANVRDAEQAEGLKRLSQSA